MLACQAAVPFCRNVDLDDRCCKLHALLKSLAPDSGTAMRGLVVKSKSRWSDRDGDLRRREERYPAVQVTTIFQTARNSRDECRQTRAR